MRTCLVWLALGMGCLAADSESIAVRGKLMEHQGKAAIETAARKLIYLEGDEPTTGVIRDARLRGSDFEARGRFTAPDRFRIDPIHTRAISVYKDGKPRLVTYWCETCGIRSWTPGKCWCCQEETALDLRDSETLPDTP
ncbi:MAG TPA: hypothetical protein VN442_16035 [Bryobacteraceae bacterium]|nr:hypothetical protein [Bryobacteraceae bacterium]